MSSRNISVEVPNFLTVGADARTRGGDKVRIESLNGAKFTVRKGGIYGTRYTVGLDGMVNGTSQMNDVIGAWAEEVRIKGYVNIYRDNSGKKIPGTSFWKTKSKAVAAGQRESTLTYLTTQEVDKTVTIAA